MDMKRIRVTIKSPLDSRWEKFNPGIGIHVINNNNISFYFISNSLLIRFVSSKLDILWTGRRWLV